MEARIALTRAKGGVQIQVCSIPLAIFFLSLLHLLARLARSSVRSGLPPSPSPAYTLTPSAAKFM